MKGLRVIKEGLVEDSDYAHYHNQTEAMKHDSTLLDSVNRKEKSLLRAHNLINMVQDKVRQQMIDEMKVADEEAREARLKKRLQREVIAQEFKKQQRRAFMPQHRNLPDYVD